jgi:hypothetical protein
MYLSGATWRSRMLEIDVTCLTLEGGCRERSSRSPGLRVIRIPRLPELAVASCGSVTAYSGGAAPDSHRLP